MRAKKQAPTLREWVMNNYGVQAAVAKYCGVSKPYIQDVLKGKFFSLNGQIEGILADLGAPGMRERQREAKKRMRTITWTDREKARLLAQIKEAKGKKRKAA